MAMEQLNAERKRLTTSRDSPVDGKSVAKRPAAKAQAVEQLNAETKRLTKNMDLLAYGKSLAKRPAAETAADPQAVPNGKRHRHAERRPRMADV